MGRPRGFDEAAVVQSAAELFAERSYDGISIDDLVTHLGLHRNSLYKTFGSKRGLYLAALRWSLDQGVTPLADRIAHAPDAVEGLRIALAAPVGGAGLELLLLASVERAPVDTEVAEIVDRAFAALDSATAAAMGTDGPAPPPGAAVALTALLLGLRLRTRSGDPAAADAVNDACPRWPSVLPSAARQP
ncbi:TetR/AcrR family transcriptional regulator [Streptomyces albipurpureus]|uniref:TetR/AcrR family transcriptional regulator n=1 Tax=Streptomyces albipurpureus TaxID=2897419 RepID=A0ABT0ULJ6_9ACTN|nr:TetR/AcrR family transcriptional regulator [Streptomyces sp. CWNU-1]MCM2389487.1 TetR/AcrR family transcriptional regulator [Streptomyces sp. CWNU-1]